MDISVLEDSAEPDEFDVRTEEQRVFDTKQAMQSLQDSLQVHALPPTQLGFGASSFAAKCRSLLHAARLEEYSNDGLAAWSSEVFGVISDSGVESHLHEVGPTAIQEILPYFCDTPTGAMEAMLGDECLQDDLLPGMAPHFQNFRTEVFEHTQPEVAVEAFEDVPEDCAREPQESVVFDFIPEPMVNFTRAYAIPGLMHVVHNATAGLQTVLTTYGERVAQAKILCRFLRKRSSRSKLLERLGEGKKG